MGVFRFRDSWRAIVYVDGKAVASRSGFKRQRDAKDWHDSERSMRKDGKEAAEEFSFEALIEKFKTWHLPKVRPGTKCRYLVDIDRRIAPFFRYMRLENIGASMLESFQAEIAQSLSPKSVNNCLHCLRLILNKAVKWRMLKESPYNLDSLAVPKQPYQWWDDRADIERFLAKAREMSRYYPVYLTALETGMRYGEIVGLCKSDIDFTEGTIHVHRQWLEREGKYGPPKHDEPRWLDFDPASEFGKVLKATAAASRHPEAVFTTKSGALPTKGGLADKFFKNIQRQAGVKRICFHALRHTYASWYMRERDNIYELKAILGHTDVKTTQRYAHHSRRAKRKPLDMASVVAHRSLTSPELAVISIQEHSEKKWRDGRDLNSKTCTPTPPMVSRLAK